MRVVSHLFCAYDHPICSHAEIIGNRSSSLVHGLSQAAKRLLAEVATAARGAHQ
jgi:hypothetical protein